MKYFRAIGILGLLGLMSCVEQHIDDSLSKASEVEGLRYAEEVKAQSPFKTVEMRWSEANELMKKRNPAFIAASERHTDAIAGKPLVGQLTREVKDTVKISFRDVLSISALTAALKAPAAELPKRLASIGKIKDLSHQIEQEAWVDAATSVDAEIAMRKEKVRLQLLLRTGRLIDQELKIAQKDPVAEDIPKKDPKFQPALDAWKNSLTNEREKWLTEIRDLFDAEYHDVRFVPDNSGFPNYRNAKNPDLAEWQRWCHLCRSKELTDELAKSHKTSKPAVPGLELVVEPLKQMVQGEQEPETLRDTASVRKEVRSLVQSWRGMKKAQEQVEELEKASDVVALENRAEIQRRQKIFKLLRDEAKHASVVWLLDEKCWK